MYRSIKTKTAIGSQETEPRPLNIIQIDQNLPGTGLDRLIPKRWCRSSTRCPTLQADEITGAARCDRTGERMFCFNYS